MMRRFFRWWLYYCVAFLLSLVVGASRVHWERPRTARDYLFAFQVALIVFLALLCCRMGLFVAKRIGWLCARFLYPDDEGIPPADYTSTKVLRQRGEFDRAAGHCLFILKYHPREVRAYHEGIACSFLAGDAAAAQRLLAMARKRFAAREDSDLLKQVEAVYRSAATLQKEMGFSPEAARFFD